MSLLLGFLSPPPAFTWTPSPQDAGGVSRLIRLAPDAFEVLPFGAFVFAQPSGSRSGGSRIGPDAFEVLPFGTFVFAQASVNRSGAARIAPDTFEVLAFAPFVFTQGNYPRFVLSRGATGEFSIAEIVPSPPPFAQLSERPVRNRVIPLAEVGALIVPGLFTFTAADAVRRVLFPLPVEPAFSFVLPPSSVFAVSSDLPVRGKMGASALTEFVTVGQSVPLGWFTGASDDRRKGGLRADSWTEFGIVAPPEPPVAATVDGGPSNWGAFPYTGAWNQIPQDSRVAAWRGVPEWLYDVDLDLPPTSEEDIANAHAMSTRYQNTVKHGLQLVAGYQSQVPWRWIVLGAILGVGTYVLLTAKPSKEA